MAKKGKGGSRARKQNQDKLMMERARKKTKGIGQRIEEWLNTDEDDQQGNK